MVTGVVCPWNSRCERFNLCSNLKGDGPSVQKIYFCASLALWPKERDPDLVSMPVNNWESELGLSSDHPTDKTAFSDLPIPGRVRKLVTGLLYQCRSVLEEQDVDRSR